MLGIRSHSILYQYDHIIGMQPVKRRKIANKGELPAPHIATARPQSAEPNPTEFIDTRDTLELHHSEIPGDSLYEPEMTDNMPLNSSEQMFIVESESGKLSQDSPKKYSKISKTQMKEFREAFGFFDKDGDGSITKDELGIVMRSLGQFASEEELKEMLKEVDINGDGTFSFDEFVQIVTNYSGGTSVTDEEQELRDAFRIFDKHNRGYISASDLRAVLHCLGEDLSEDEIEDMIKEVDVDGDGRIDFNEFVRALGEPDSDEEEGDSPFTFAQPI